MHKAVKIWINEQQGDMNDPTSPGRQLHTSSRSLFLEQTALLGQTQGLIHWTSYEIPMGGKFPRSPYLSAASNMQMLATCMALITHATRGIDLSVPNTSSNPGLEVPTPENNGADVPDKWIHQLAHATESSNFGAHMTASLLYQLAGALSSNSALPPYLSPPENFPLMKKLREVNIKAMHMENIREAEFSAFACMEVAASLLSLRLKDLIENVKDLVGEVKFDVSINGEGSEREKVL